MTATLIILISCQLRISQTLSNARFILKKLWQKTGDVEKLRKRGGRPKSLDEYLEQAIVQIFLENVDITIEEALDWLSPWLSENATLLSWHSEHQNLVNLNALIYIFLIISERLKRDRKLKVI
jgi:hypothetical protein